VSDRAIVRKLSLRCFPTAKWRLVTGVFSLPPIAAFKSPDMKHLPNEWDIKEVQRT